MRALDDLLANAIKPNAEAIAEIISEGDIAIVAYKPGDEWRQALGIQDVESDAWIARMSPAMRRGLIDRGDSVTSRWAKGNRDGRMFVVMFGGTLLVNFNDGAYTIEPGSLDEDAS